MRGRQPGCRKRTAACEFSRAHAISYCSPVERLNPDWSAEYSNACPYFACSISLHPASPAAKVLTLAKRDRSRLFNPKDGRASYPCPVGLVNPYVKVHPGALRIPSSRTNRPSDRVNLAASLLCHFLGEGQIVLPRWLGGTPRNCPLAFLTSRSRISLRCYRCSLVRVQANSRPRRRGPPRRLRLFISWRPQSTMSTQRSDREE